MKRSRRAVPGVCQALLMGLAPAAFAQNIQSPASRAPVNLGLLTSVTGAGAGLGIPERNGALLAGKTIRDGVSGRPIRIFVEDDGSNPEIALSKGNDLIHNRKVVAIIGPILAASTVAVGSLTDPMKFLPIAFTGLGPSVELSASAPFMSARHRC
jgi:branched-chain amino acid transport system substrate-binding protein